MTIWLVEVGKAVGEPGITVGSKVGTTDGTGVGMRVGPADGCGVGDKVGSCGGLGIGVIVGSADGLGVCASGGFLVGRELGQSWAATVG